MSGMESAFSSECGENVIYVCTNSRVKMSTQIQIQVNLSRAQGLHFCQAHTGCFCWSVDGLGAGPHFR